MYFFFYNTRTRTLSLRVHLSFIENSCILHWESMYPSLRYMYSFIESSFTLHWEWMYSFIESTWTLHGECMYCTLQWDTCTLLFWVHVTGTLSSRIKIDALFAKFLYARTVYFLLPYLVPMFFDKNAYSWSLSTRVCCSVVEPEP